jgi:hypothetical protein
MSSITWFSDNPEAAENQLYNNVPPKVREAYIQVHESLQDLAADLA